MLLSSKLSLRQINVVAQLRLQRRQSKNTISCNVLIFKDIQLVNNVPTYWTFTKLNATKFCLSFIAMLEKSESCTSAKYKNVSVVKVIYQEKGKENGSKINAYWKPYIQNLFLFSANQS
jgi:hypothetical protein